MAPVREGKFVDAKQTTAAVLQAIQLDENDYRLGHTKARFNSTHLLSRVAKSKIVPCRSFNYSPPRHIDFTIVVEMT